MDLLTLGRIKDKIWFKWTKLEDAAVLKNLGIFMKWQVVMKANRLLDFIARGMECKYGQWF